MGKEYKVNPIKTTQPPDYSFKDDIKLHEELKQLNLNAYKPNEQPIPEGYEKLNYYYNKNNGFDSYVYKKDDSVVIVYKGSETPHDLFTYARMWARSYSSQYKDAQAVCNKVRKKYPNSKIYTTGHSLDGGLSQFVASINNVPSYEVFRMHKKRR